MNPGGAITGCSGWKLLSFPDTWDTRSGSVTAGTPWELQMKSDADHSVRVYHTE